MVRYRGPVILTPIAERLAVELSLPVFTTSKGLPRLGIEHPTFRLQGQRSNTLRHGRGPFNYKDIINLLYTLMKSNHKT